ncbi:MAG: DUF87 domain-containing protein [Candidatus Aenigmatarchaeota archaeon]
MRVLGILVDRVEPKRAKVLVNDDLFAEGFPILNSMVEIPFVRQNKECVAVGFITNFYHLNELFEELELSKNLKNLTDHPVINSIIVKKNFLIAEVELVSAFTTEWERVPLDSAIKIGTQVYKMEKDSFFMSSNKKFNYLGTFYGESIPQPLYLSDFQELQEAYHFCIAGQTGSGKSTLAKMVLSLYAAKSPAMSFIIIDPVGEFSNSFKGEDKSGFNLNLRDIWLSVGRSFEIYNLDNIHFDRWELFQKLMCKKKVFDPFRILTEPKRQSAAEKLVSRLRTNGIPLTSLCDEKSGVCSIVTSEDFVKQVYAGDREVARTLEAVGETQAVEEFWDNFVSVAKYFYKTEGKKSIDGIIRGIGYQKRAEEELQSQNIGRTIIFDLSSLSFGEEDIKYLLVYEICSLLYQVSLELYKQKIGRNLNTLVVLDEAHNFAPASYLIKDNEELKKCAEQITKAFIETRKFGLGWMVISTRIGNLEKKLYEHSRVKMLGFGLHTGSDRDLIVETFGKDIIHRYSILPDPTDPLFNKKEVAFLIDGPITVLSRNTPEFIKVFDSVEEFLNMNGFMSF